MNRLTFKNKIIILLSTLFLVIISSVAFYIYPTFSKISKVKNELHEQRVQLAILEQQRSDLETTRRDYNNIKDDIDQVSKIFLKKDSIPDLISDLEKYSNGKEITQEISLGNLDANSQLKLTLSLTGNNSNIVDYISNLENLNIYLIITDFNLDQNEGDTSIRLDSVIYTN